MNKALPKVQLTKKWAPGKPNIPIQVRAALSAPAIVICKVNIHILLHAFSGVFLFLQKLHEV